MRRRSSHYVFTSKPIRHPVRNFLLVTFILIASIVLMIWAVNYGLTHQPKYDRVTVTVPTLPDDLQNWTILHFSDLHGESFGRKQSAIAGVLGTPNVSSVVFSGDMVGPDGDVTALLELAALLPADKPKLFLPGDEDPPYLDPTAHSSLSPKAAWAEQLENAGITILDEPVLFTRGRNDRARIWFIPADLYTLDLSAMQNNWQRELDRYAGRQSLTADEAAARRVAEYQLARISRIRLSISEIKAGDIQIAVTHMPLSAQEMQSAARHDDRNTIFSLRRVDLILAGHYCAGQVRLPLLGAPYVPGIGNWPDDSLITGLNYLGTIPQYISPGMASSVIYPKWASIRFMNQPVFTRISLTSKYQ